MSSRQGGRRPAPDGRGGEGWLARAWTAIALVPMFFFLAFAVGEGLYSLLGYRPGNGDAPTWVVTVVAVLVVGVVLVPCSAAFYFGRRAVQNGDRRGFVPLVIGSVAAGGWIGLTIVSEVGTLIRR